VQFHNLATQLAELLPPQLPISSPELWNDASRSYGSAPPSYHESFADLPPDYTSTDALAFAQTPEYTFFPSLNASLCSDVPNCLRLSCDSSPSSSIFFDEKSLYADIDFGFNDEGVRSHAKKGKNKPAAKQTPTPAQTSGDGDKKKDEEATGSGDNSGGDPPADGGGGGGDGGDGGGGDKGNNDEPVTSKKAKKKTKKEIEEEERVKKEEEERIAKAAEEEAELKKKEEEDAAVVAAAAAATSKVADISWAEPAQNNDEWSSFAAPAGKSKKKGKKGKVRNLGYVMTPCGALTDIRRNRHLHHHLLNHLHRSQHQPLTISNLTT
jgi:hypothetical protein